MSIGYNLMVAAVVLISCADALADSGQFTETRRVPLVALVANPERYDGAQIEVVSWGVIEFEGAALYLSPSDHEHLVAEAGVWLEVPPDGAFPTRAQGYLAVVGRFNSGDKARGFAGRITDIKKLNVLDKSKL